MSTTAIQGFLKWITGTTAADTVVNDISDKLDKRLNLSVISMTTDAEPVSPSNGDAYIITGSATGTDWATFSQYDVAVYRDGAWSAEAPLKGLQVHVQDESNAQKVWTGSAYSVPSGGSTFLDNAFRIQDNGDNTKQIAFEAGGITPATTRTVTVPDESITIAGIIDEDDMSSDSATLVPSQQSVKTYVDASVTKYAGVNNQTGTSYTLVIGDAGYLVTMNNAAANTLTIPANSSVAFPVGTRIDVLQLGAGQTTIAITTDTLNGNTKIDAQYEVVSLLKIASTTWVVAGGVA